METRIVVDTSIIINAYNDPQEGNLYWDFLQKFQRMNQKQPKLQMCIDMTRVMLQEYEQALVTLFGTDAWRNFYEWFEDTVVLQAVSAEDGLIRELFGHEESLKAKCNNTELVFVSRAYHNRKTQGCGIIVTDECDFVSYRKSFFNPEIKNYLRDNMKVKITTLDSVDYEIKNIWGKDQLPIILWDKMRQAFNKGELEDLRFVMRAEWSPPDNVPLQSQIRDFIEFCKRRNLLFDLCRQCQQERPGLVWPDCTSFI
ncbi:MAG: hypothetical protein H6658_09860 [Ardenticatenaceae bacterium]|nr:hypothetical protein [Ardenticatenaceae bacterium]